MIVAAFLGTQLLLARLVPPVTAMSNVRWWTWLGELMREHGFFEVWTPYPPLFPALFRLAHILFAAGLPHAQAVERVTAAWMVFNSVLLLGCTALVFAICRRRLAVGETAKAEARGKAALAATAFLLINLSWRSGILVGPRMDQFEYLPLAFLLGGLLALMRRRHVLAAVLCALGTATKLFPAVLLPLILLDARGKWRWASGALFAAVCAALCAPGLLANRGIFLSTWRWSGDRPAWETPYRYPWQSFFAETLTPERRGLLRRCRFALPPMHGSKSQMAELFAAPYRGPSQPPSDLDKARQPSALVRHGLPLLTLIAAVAFLVLRRRRLSRADWFPEAALVLLLILLVFSKGVSSYFIVWLMPLICVVFPGLAGFVLCAALLLVGNAEIGAMARAVGPAPTDPASLRANSLFWASILARHAMFALLAVYLSLRRAPARKPQSNRGRGVSAPRP